MTKSDVEMFIHCRHCIENDDESLLELGLNGNATVLYIGCMTCKQKVTEFELTVGEGMGPVE
jgi:hypothetical protein